MVSSTTGRSIAATFIIAGLAACSGTPTSPNGALAPSTASLAAVNGTAEVAEFEVCKQYSGTAGPAVTVNYTVDFDANGSNEVSSSVQLSNGQCAVVHTYQEAGSNGGTQIQRVTVTEQVPVGYTATVRRTTILGATTTVGPTVTGNSASGDMISNPDNGFLVLFTNTAVPPPPPPPTPGTGRFTGGGTTVVGNVRISNGLTIHCDRLLSNNLEVNWGGNRFHMEEHLTTVACTDDPAIDQRPPNAPIDTLIGTGTGRYNGTPGYTIEFTLVDGGEPGSRDRIALRIYPTGNPGGAVLTLPLQTVTTGNLQAHFDQPHK